MWLLFDLLLAHFIVAFLNETEEIVAMRAGSCPNTKSRVLFWDDLVGHGGIRRFTGSTVFEHWKSLRTDVVQLLIFLTLTSLLFIHFPTSSAPQQIISRIFSTFSPSFLVSGHKLSNFADEHLSLLTFDSPFFLVDRIFLEGKLKKLIFEF